MNCVYGGGVCPKPERTYGEPHYCKHADFHEGPHICRRCGLEFWLEPSYPQHIIDIRRANSGSGGT